MRKEIGEVNVWIDVMVVGELCCRTCSMEVQRSDYGPEHVGKGHKAIRHR